MTININKMNDTIQDTIKVGLANASAIGISLTEINEVLSTISLVMAISFSIYQFIKQKK
jgi:EamA domain-containing membrane protein RarD|tara:strand:- start:2467 stop:2643 length:177 start_codon:yes stop_codon:yes gene_type:complete